VENRKTVSQELSLKGHSLEQAAEKLTNGSCTVVERRFSAA
jgi:hypothetical protein